MAKSHKYVVRCLPCCCVALTFPPSLHTSRLDHVAAHKPGKRYEMNKTFAIEPQCRNVSCNICRCALIMCGVCVWIVVLLWGPASILQSSQRVTELLVGAISQWQQQQMEHFNMKCCNRVMRVLRSWIQSRACSETVPYNCAIFIGNFWWK